MPKVTTIYETFHLSSLTRNTITAGNYQRVWECGQFSSLLGRNVTKRENSRERDRGVKGRAGDTILRRALIMSQPFQRHRCHVALFLRVLFGRARIWNNQSRFTEIATRIVPQGLDDVGRNARRNRNGEQRARRGREKGLSEKFHQFLDN